MPDTSIATSEADIWAALQLDLEPQAEGDPAPVDRDFVRSLIVGAEHRIAQFCGVAPIDMDEIPPNLAAAIRLDVATYYFSRLSPVLPLAWDELIAPYRQWGFGGSTNDEA